MKSIRQRVLNGEVVSGTWLVTGSSICAEIAGQAGFDWVLLDLEHGMGDLESLLVQLQALESTPAVPVVRVLWNEAPVIKRVLDLGASGVMVPYVSTPEEATAAVRAMRYPPQGIRGLTPLNRGTAFGARAEEYFQTANESLLTIVQIETAQGAKNADAIAAIDGVDVLFVGPMDLSLGMGVYRQFDHATFREAIASVLAACKKHKKAAGLFVANTEQADKAVADGFTFIGLSSEGGELATAMQRLAKHCEKYSRG